MKYYTTVAILAVYGTVHARHHNDTNDGQMFLIKPFKRHE